MTEVLKRLKLRSAGMFSNVNEVVEQLRRAEAGGYRFAIEWSESCYLDHHRSDDPWEYYFEPCFANLPKPDASWPELMRGAQVACARDNIITPRLEDGVCNPLLLPRDRLGAADLIARYIKPRSEVCAGVEAFVRAHFRTKMIGLHVRGAGRTDGGVPELRRRFGASDEVPLEPFFLQTDAALKLLPDAGIFACSDSSRVLNAIQARYPDRAVSYPSQRSDFGEMHANHPQNADLRFDPFLLGLDVLTEALLLARTDLFVHGNSNVANFVICKSPFLIHAYVQA